MKIKNLVCLLIAMFLTASAAATIVDIGTGDNTAGLYVEWSDGFSVEYAVNFSTDSITGWDLFDAVMAETDLTTVVENFGWGDFIDGISLGEHSDIGYNDGANWWHFWIKDADQDWVSPAFGISDRVLYDGDMDGWVYGRDTIPEPASVLLLAAGSLLFRRRSA